MAKLNRKTRGALAGLLAMVFGAVGLPFLANPAATGALVEVGAEIVEYYTEEQEGEDGAQASGR